MESTTESREGRSYTFRSYEPGDERAFLDLFELVWGERRDEEWFRWRFESNPYLDGVPLFVVETDGTVVGVRPFLALRMAVGGETALGLLTVDTMVHPDHRGRGLFTTMTERSLEYYADREPAFVFNQPNAASRPGFRKLGFRELDASTTYYRIQRPSAFFGRRPGLPDSPALARLADGVASAYRRLRDGAEWETSGVGVRRHAGVATGELARLARRAAPAGITARRDERFYGWRFASPEWRRRTYVASVDGERVAGILARTRTTAEGITVTQVADFAPLSGGTAWKLGLAGGLERVVADATASEVVAAPARSFPADVAASYGFLPDDRPPLESVASADAALCVRSLGEGWRVNDLHLCDPGNWMLTFAERDTS
jgi:GNAT superfamily N-acetyltransferase